MGDRKDAFGGRGRSGWRRVAVSVLVLFVYAVVGMVVGVNEVCSSRFGRSMVGRCDVELFALRGVDRHHSTADSVWSFASGPEGVG